MRFHATKSDFRCEIDPCEAVHVAVRRYDYDGLPRFYLQITGGNAGEKQLVLDFGSETVLEAILEVMDEAYYAATTDPPAPTGHIEVFGRSIP